MIVYLNSQAFKGYVYGRHEHYLGDLDVLRIIEVDKGTSIPDMVTQIIHSGKPDAQGQKLPLPEHTIWRLIINCHGLPGELQIGCGIDINNVSLLAALKPYMAAFTYSVPGVLIDSCLVASGRISRETWEYLFTDIPMLIGNFSEKEKGIGFKFVQAMANVLDTKVTAPIEVQWSNIGSEPDYKSQGIEGDFIRVFPHGKGKYQYVAQNYAAQVPFPQLYLKETIQQYKAIFSSISLLKT